MKRQANSMTARAETMENILNALNIAIYVSDLTTNEILYANMAQRKRHNDQPLVGRICWEAFEGRSSRCGSCPIPYLLRYPGRTYQKETYNGYHLKVYDSIIPWEDGRLAHLRYIVEITNSAMRE